MRLWTIFSTLDAKKPQEKKTLKEEEKDQGVEMTQDFEGEMYDIPSDEEQNNESEGTCIVCQNAVREHS